MPGPVDELLKSFDAKRVAADTRALAAPAMAGRIAGSEGEQRAAEHVAQALGEAGLEPLREADGLFDPFDLTVADLTALPSLAVHAGAESRSFAYLEDYCVNVQGAAGGGTAEGETVWLGALEESFALPPELRGRVGVCRGGAASDAADLTAALGAYLLRLRRARAGEALGLLQLGGRTNLKKTMIHCRERPTLPSVDVSEAVGRALFGPAGASRVGQIGERISLRVPLEHRSVTSAGNLAATVGQGPIRLVLCAHYDHVGGLPDGRHFPGASDNASGVAVLLETARVLAAGLRSKDYRKLWLMTSAEEIGMLGARRFVERFGELLHPAAVVINVDEVGGGEGAAVHLLRAPGFAKAALGPADRAAVGAPLGFHSLAPAGFSDCAPFMEQGVARVAAVFSRDLERQVAHTLDDTPDRIAPATLAAAGRAVLLMARRLEAGW